MKIQNRARVLTAAAFLCAAAACSGRVDIAKVPVGSEVQITQQDGAVIEGTLTTRSETAVSIKTARGARAVERAQIADLQVVTPDKPATLPATAKFREYVVPDGAVIELTLVTPASSETSNAGDAIEATLSDDVKVGDVIAIPQGATVHGKVAEAKSAGKVEGRAILALHFDEVVAQDEHYPISAGISVEAPSTKKKDAATIGIPAAAGAIIGGILGGGKGAATGAAIGGGGGTAVVLFTEGKPVEFGRGMTMRLTLRKDVEVRVPVR